VAATVRPTEARFVSTVGVPSGRVVVPVTASFRAPLRVGCNPVRRAAREAAPGAARYEGRVSEPDGLPREDGARASAVPGREADTMAAALQRSPGLRVVLAGLLVVGLVLVVWGLVAREYALSVSGAAGAVLALLWFRARRR
jgi:hypothetical protein